MRAGGERRRRSVIHGGRNHVLDPKEQLDILLEDVVEAIKEDELLEKLERACREERPLRVKQGFDPSAPDLHLGHAIGLRKLKQFQELGHTVVVIIGDYTGMIGDPSERAETRPRLTHQEVTEHAKTYQEQLYKIVDPARTEVRMNGEWFSQMSFADVMDLAGRYTVARILERDDFARRFQNQQPISIHELFYPLMQGYDSVAIRADVELGATEQKFNCLVGRELQKAYDIEPQIVMLLPVLEGTDGVKRMSKSTGNYIGIAEAPREIYGKTMSIPDSSIPRYFELGVGLKGRELAAVRDRLESPEENPRDLKRELARRLVSLYYDEQEARAAEEEFDRVFRKRGLPDEIPEPSIELRGQEDRSAVWIVPLLKAAGLVKSNGEARRLIQQGGIRVDGEQVTDVDYTVSLDRPLLLQAGKRRFARALPDRVRLLQEDA
ncbi:MAG: tyrosine--tRNA ligase [Candidatus Eisenbacteria bacterium]|nr:tyrosine--tRNA ligase [Candidatus Eisenbacteria bacterium]